MFSPDLFLFWIPGLHLQQHRVCVGVFENRHLADVCVELRRLVHVDDRQGHEGRGFLAILQPLHERLWVPSVDLKLVGLRGLEVQGLQERHAAAGEEGENETEATAKL